MNLKFTLISQNFLGNEMEGIMKLFNFENIISA